MDIGSTPYNYFQVYAKSDTVAVPADPNGNACQAIFNAASGNIVVANEDGSTTLFTTVPAGIIPISPYRINSTNTTAGPFVALYRI